ncbi:MAG: hypothetical protein ACP5Q5_10715 [Brevinematia bacterium]
MAEKEVMEKLKEIVSQREERFYLSGGEVFVWWGVLSLLAHNIYNLLLPNIFVWIGMIVLGNAGMIAYIAIAFKGGYKTFWGKMLGEFWGFLTILLVFVFYIFPFVLKLFPPMAIYPLILFCLAVGMYVSGLIAQSIAFKVGGIIFLVSSVLLAYNTTWFFWIYNAGTFFGLVIPGIWSRYEKRK